MTREVVVWGRSAWFGQLNPSRAHGPMEKEEGGMLLVYCRRAEALGGAVTWLTWPLLLHSLQNPLSQLCPERR